MKFFSLNFFNKDLEKYLIKKFVKNFIFCFFIILSILFLIEFVELLRKTSENASVSSIFVVLNLSLMKICESINVIIPLIFFCTTISVCSVLNKHKEMIIIQNIGLSSFRILYPFIALTIIFCVFYITLFNPYISHTTNLYQKKEQQIFRGKLNEATISKSGIFLRQGSEKNKIVIRASSFLPNQGLFKNATFYIFTKKNHFIERIDAKKAKLEKEFWVMNDVIINRPNKKVVNIDEYSLKTNLSINNIENSFLEPQSLSIWKLPDFISLLNESGFSSTKHEIYLYKSLLLPFFLSGLILIAGAFTIKFTKTTGKTVFLVFTALLFGFLIYYTSEYIYALGVANRLNTYVASMAPSLITVLIGVFFILHFEKTR